MPPPPLLLLLMMMMMLLMVIVMVMTMITCDNNSSAITPFMVFFIRASFPSCLFLYSSNSYQESPRPQKFSRSRSISSCTSAFAFSTRKRGFFRWQCCCLFSHCLLFIEQLHVYKTLLYFHLHSKGTLATGKSVASSPPLPPRISRPFALNLAGKALLWSMRMLMFC